MKALRGTLHLWGAQLLEVTRSRTAVFWSLAFPVAWVLLAGFVFGGGEAENVTFLMPGVFTVILITGAFFSVTFRMVSQREAGILRRYRATPVSALAVVLAHGATSMVLLTVSLLLQLATGILVFDADVRGSWAALALVLLAAEAAFVPLGLLVGSVARDQRSAPVLTHAIFFPMMFLSGAAVPFHLLPDWIQAVGRALPSTWTMEALHSVAVLGRPLSAAAAPVAVLLVTGVVAALVNALVFRWESEEPLRPRRVAGAVLALVALYGAVALLGPSLALRATP